MHGGKYGVTRDFVIALRGFLPTGEFVQWGTATKKFSAGFNLRDLWIGSEGMLGVVTGAVLKLIPRPAERWTLLTSFKDETAALGRRWRFSGSRVQPAICEFLDRESVLCAERATGRTGVFRTTLRQASPAGRDPAGACGFARRGARTAGSGAAWASEYAPRTARRAPAPRPSNCGPCAGNAPGAMFELGDAKLNEDIVVPMKNYVKFARFSRG
jgi:glycolate oxidase